MRRPSRLDAIVFDQLANSKQSRSCCDEVYVHAAELQPSAVAAGIDAVERSATRWVGLEDVALETLSGNLGLKEQSARHQ
jgi:hypothetical protein